MVVLNHLSLISARAATAMSSQRDEVANKDSSEGDNSSLAEKGKADVSSPASATSVSVAHVWFCIVYEPP